MKRRKILVVIPALGLLLTGCSFQEGFATAKHWVGQNIYHPVKDWIDGLMGKKDETTPEPTPDPTPDPTPTPSDVAVTGVTVAPETLTLTVGGEDATLTATVAPSDATNKSVTWSVAPEGVVTVSQAGVVHAEAAGDAVVTVTSVADATKKATCTVKVNDETPPGPGDNDGSLEHPYTVAEARAVATAEERADTHVKGIIYKVDSFNAKYGSITYWISDDGTGSSGSKDGLQIYGGLGIEGAQFTGVEDLSVGDNVVVKGNLMIFSETTYEFSANSVLISRTVPTVASVAVSGTAATTEYAVGQKYSRNGLVASATLSNNVVVNVSEKADWAINPEVASKDDKKFEVTATYGGKTSPVFEVEVTVQESIEPAYHAATMTKGTSAYDDVTVNGKNAIKLGTSKKGGDMTITVAEKATKLRFYAVAWKGEGGESCPVTLSAGEGITITPNTFNPVADESISGTATAFVLEDTSAFFVEVELSGVEAESLITLTSTKRAIVFEAEYFA